MEQSAIQYLNGLSNGIYLATALIMLLFGLSYLNKRYNWRIVLSFVLIALSFLGFGLFNAFIQQSYSDNTFFPELFFRIVAQVTPLSMAMLFFVYLRAFSMRSLDAHKLIVKFKWLEYFVYALFVAVIYYILFLDSTTAIIQVIVLSFIPSAVIMAFIAFWSSGPYIIGHIFGVIFSSVAVICMYLVSMQESLDYQNIVYVFYFIFAFTALLLGFFIVRFGYKELESFFLVQSMDQYHILHDINKGIHSDQFYIEYQPQIHLASDNINGAEALIRWQHPSKGLIPPDHFIPLAEQSGMIDVITKWVVSEVLKDAVSIFTDNEDFRVSINFSPRNFNDEVVSHLHSEMIRYQVPAHAIMIEITEGLMISENDRVVQKAMKRVKDMGIMLSIDDYGTGFSSLRYLQKNSINELKIDKTFVSNISKNDENYAIVYSTIQMSRNLGLKIVAEGVEDLDTIDLLKEMGCTTVQGFAIARPMLLEKLQEMIHHHKA